MAEAEGQPEKKRVADVVRRRGLRGAELGLGLHAADHPREYSGGTDAQGGGPYQAELSPSPGQGNLHFKAGNLKDAITCYKYVPGRSVQRGGGGGAR